MEQLNVAFKNLIKDNLMSPGSSDHSFVYTTATSSHDVYSVMKSSEMK